MAENMKDNGDAQNIHIQFRSAGGKKVDMDVEPSWTVAQLKETLAATTELPRDGMRLIYAGRILNDQATVEFYGVKDGHTVHVVRGASNQAQQEAAQASASSTHTGTSSTGTTQESSRTAPGPGGLFMPSSGGFPSLEEYQQQLLANPEMMDNLMNSPMMQQMFNNPEMMQMVLSSNPQMQSLLDRNPELRHVLSDPQTLRQTMSLMSNPSLRREMTRSNDRAMANIENHPEGFSMLRRMYTDIEETMADAPTNPFAALAAGAQATPTSTASASANGNTANLPNPWAPSQSPEGQQPAPATGVGSSQILQLLSNPAVQSMMQSMANNPELMSQSLQMMRDTPSMQNNPFMQQWLANPQLLRQMVDPQNMQAILQMRQAVEQLQSSGLLPTIPGAEALPGALPAGMASMFGATSPRESDTRPPEERYAQQLQQLNDMGFVDRERNLGALQATNGNVNAAVERLLG